MEQSQCGAIRRRHAIEARSAQRVGRAGPCYSQSSLQTRRNDPVIGRSRIVAESPKILGLNMWSFVQNEVQQSFLNLKLAVVFYQT
jgi:hypothetical protein